MSGHNSCGNSFRKTKIHATIGDINRQNEPQLSPNLIGESYENSDHYFETHFNLLREESVRPLVEAVNDLRKLLDTEKENNKNQSTETTNEVKDNQNKIFKEKVEKEIETNVYFDIKLTEPEVVFDPNYGSVLKFTFDYKPIENIDLIDCQHLMNGGILCLSSDNFEKSIVFGLIVKSQLRAVDKESGERLWNFCLKLDLSDNNCKQFNEFLLRPKTSYIGVESPSFFEGFRHSLKRLQTMSEDFPLNPYIIKTSKDIKAPPYLTEETTYDMSCIKLKESEDSDQSLNSDIKPNSLSSVNLMKNDVFGETKLYNRGIAALKNCSTFDTKQFDAFYAALTKELCVIEGPPGTGKTFVGLKIVECLLNNIQVWNQSSKVRPLLIVCYKNHALDQFLEGIIKFNKNVVRIGGNSESKELEDYKLGTIETKYREELKLQKELKIKTEEDVKQMTNGIKLLDPKLISDHKKYEKLRFRIMSLHNLVVMLTQKIRQSFQTILDFKDVEPYIKPKSLHKQFPEPKSLEDWLNSENDINFSNICGKQLNKKRLSMEAFDDISTIIKKNVFSLKPNEKWLLYLYWREQLFKNIGKELKDKFKTMAEEFEKLGPKKLEFQRNLLKGAEVIGLTVTGAAKYSDLVKIINPKIMIVEEAAEVLEGHVVAALSSTIEHLILIGDHKQLRPLTNVQELTDQYFLDISMFERLVKNGLPFIQLEKQHRMRPCISELLKVAKIYDNLRNGEKVFDYPNIEYTFKKNMYFLDHQNIEDNKFCRDVPDKSRSNLHEAKLVVELVKYFLLHNYPEDKITVLTTYNAQLSVIRKLMSEQKNVFVKEVIVDNSSKSKYKHINSSNQSWTHDCNGVKPNEVEEQLRIRVSSVDGFQGEENDIIIISFVRSSKRNVIGFLGNKNRVNVALSRAKHALYCVGNFTIMAKEDKTKMWSQLTKHLCEQNCFGEELNLGCDCTGQQSISMPGQLLILNHQLTNGRCKCQKLI